MKYSILKEIAIIFHNGSNYEYDFIMKELAEKFKGQYPCLGENTKKYIIFSFPIEAKDKRIGKNGEKMTKAMCYKLKLIDSTRFIASSLRKS